MKYEIYDKKEANIFITATSPAYQPLVSLLYLMFNAPTTGTY